MIVEFINKSSTKEMKIFYHKILYITVKLIKSLVQKDYPQQYISRWMPRFTVTHIHLRKNVVRIIVLKSTKIVMNNQQNYIKQR
jgi:hypothetical protein